MGKGYLIDTNALIDYSVNRLPEKGSVLLSTLIDYNPQISFIIKIELLAFADVSNDILDFVNSSFVYGISDDIIEQTIEIRKHFKVKLPDAIIAATAITNELILVTANIGDFKKIPQLEYINLHDMK